MRIRGGAVAALAVTLALAGCAPGPMDDSADVSLHLQQRLDVAFNPDQPGGIDRPPSGAVRFALPNGWGGLMGRCMNESGFADFGYDRFYGFTNGGEVASRSGAEGLAWYGCTKQYPEYDTVFAKFTDDELDALYDYYAEYLVPCLESLGASVTSMPSRTDFADGGEGQAGWWNPFLAVAPPASTADVDLLYAKCEPYPDAVRL